MTEGSLELFATEGRYCIHAGQIGVISPRQMHSGFAGNEGVDYHVIMFDVETPCNGTAASDRYLVPIHNNEVFSEDD